MRSVVLGVHAYVFTLSIASRDTAILSAVDRYEAFRQQYNLEHHRPLETDPVGHAGRLAVFERSRAEVEALNARPGASWTAGLTRFADFTEDEFKALLGYRRLGYWWGDADVGSSFLETRPHQKVVAKSMDWRSRLNTSASFQRDQGSCGSCWAVASVGALEMHAEIRHGHTHPLSFEQLVDCVPNPRRCGGDGGCKGATAELAFEYVHGHGLMPASAYRGYDSGGDGKCKPPSKESTVTEGFERLPENKYRPLLETVATKGPVVVSVDAQGWNLYRSGVYDSCSKNATVNHAVLLVGYGHDPETSKDYWLIRNSWGHQWGEDGYIRLQRHTSDEGDDGYCGVDHDPKVGVGCDGSPPQIPVCGMCGVLSDSSYPKNVQISPSVVL